MNALLKKMNQIPFDLTIRHYFPFDNVASDLKDNELNSAESWDVLRLIHPHFSIPQNREDWIRTCELGTGKDGLDGRLVPRAQQIVELVREKGYTSIFSVGVGFAALEYHLKKQFPSLRLIISEYAPNNVEILRKVFPECDKVIQFDILGEDWSVVGNNDSQQLCLMWRVDPHFTNKQWRTIFQNMHSSKVINILYVPARILTIHYLLVEKRRYVFYRLLNKPISFSGHIRTRSVIRKFWQSLYCVEQEFKLETNDAFLLRLI